MVTFSLFFTKTLLFVIIAIVVNRLKYPLLIIMGISIFYYGFIATSIQKKSMDNFSTQTQDLIVKGYENISAKSIEITQSINKWMVDNEDEVKSYINTQKAD